MEVVGSPFRFTGEQLDDNGLLYLRARYYSPELGVFTGLDPLEGDVAQVMSLNRYGYVAGNVINAIDPSGMSHERPESHDPCQQENDCNSNSSVNIYRYFRYNGELAARKAKSMAAQGTRGDVSDGIVDGIPFVGTGTDSARFISLALRAGGFPMTTTGNCECNASQPIGWCAGKSGGLFQGNPIWRNHVNVDTASLDGLENSADLTSDTRLAGYLLGNPAVLGDGVQFYGSPYFTAISVDDVIGKTTGGESYFPTTAIRQDILENGKYNEIALNLAKFVSRYARLEAGDYMVTIPPVGSGGNDGNISSSHGFIITHMATATKCDGTPLEHATVKVPYVTDLPGVQSGHSRPFYCTRIPDDPISNSGFFIQSRWYFIKVPRSGIIKRSKLFSDPLP